MSLNITVLDCNCVIPNVKANLNAIDGVALYRVENKLYVNSNGFDFDRDGVIELCCATVAYARQNAIREIIFNVDGFAENSTKSYAVDMLYGGLLQADNRDILLLSVKLCVNLPKAAQVDLDGNNGVEERDFLCESPEFITRFNKFVKGLENEPLFREYLLQVFADSDYTKYSELYKASGISKYTFSKILNYNINPPYKPSKNTVSALAIGLKFSVEQAERFFTIAGYHLGTRDFVDKTLRFFLSTGNYDIDEINAFLYMRGYPLLGERFKDAYTALI